MIYTVGIPDLYEKYRNITPEQCIDYFTNKSIISIDCETTGTDCHKDKIISLQLGDKENQFFIDTRVVDIKHFKDLIESKNCILQNAKFDYKMLKAAGINLENIYDTMVAECVLYCGYKKWGYGLDDLIKRYLDIEISKEERLGFTAQGAEPFTVKQIEYGCTDVRHLETIKDLQSIRAKEENLEYCISLENKALKALGDIEYNGMGFNAEKWLKIAKETKEKVEKIYDTLDEIVVSDERLAKEYKAKFIQGNLFGLKMRDVNINYASPIQVLKICHLLGYNIPDTSERELGKLAKIEKDEVKSAKHPFFGQLLLLRKNEKIVSTYGESFLEYINPVTGRIHTSFWQIKDTGRVSSGDPNVQNIPADNKFRNCFEARKGFKWVSIDYSGQELRLMADGSGEQGFIDVLNSGEDLHCYAGTMMFKKPVTKEDKDLRNKAKTINFGKPYGMGVPKLADTLHITEEESAKLFKEYAAAFPTLNKWLENQSALAKKYHYSVTFAPCQRKRFYPQMIEAEKLRRVAKRGDRGTWRDILKIEGQVERYGGNAPIQGTAADCIKEALVLTRDLILKYNHDYNEEVVYLICTVHDAIDLEVREDLAEEIGKKVGEIMIEVGGKYVKKVKMDVDTTYSSCWTK